ncbi:helix-turn-helix transcriptional regulator [Pedobacter panaciterrae]|uniref:Helix-turn-helix transcriptional regulator n=1 Tax=Pedobacter panaciterrae TaxID=363849 RepID=A0ABU8NHF6_9SPHI
MLVFGSQMHLLTLVILILELMLLPFVLWYYYAWPKDKTRLWYFILLLLLIFYNLTGGLFPDPRIDALSIQVQNMIAYGSGFGMATFFPYYFYRSFQLQGLKFHAIYGAPLLLMLPYLVFFWLVYPLTGDLNLVITYGMVVPFFYSPVLLWAILRSIRQRFSDNSHLLYPYGPMEMRAVYWAVAPWVCMTGISYLRVAQWIEVLVTNSGFILITVLFMLRAVRTERMEKQRMMERDAVDLKLQADFRDNCRMYHLSKRECEVSELLCHGLTYREIAEHLFISESTVDAHVQRIFLKTGVNKKIDLQKTLGYGVLPEPGYSL